MQQLAPVNMWGNIFFVPATHFTRDIVRIVASQNNTNITQIGGILRPDVPGTQPSLDALQAGQFVELEIGSAGCYIQADKPIGVCSFISNCDLTANPVQCWIPAIEQTVFRAQIAPFVPNLTYLEKHYALICSPTDAKDSTKVSVGGTPFTDLTGGSWIDNAEANMSFYITQLNEDTVPYIFTNQKGLIVLCYASGNPVSSYYYPAGFATRNLDAAFYVSDIHYQELDAEFFCDNNFQFRAEVENMGIEINSLKWYLNNTEETSAQNLYVWNKTLVGGNYTIKLVVYPNIGEPRIMEGNLHVNPHITATPVPEIGGTVNIADTCIKIGAQLTLIATPAPDYVFVNWTNGATVMGTNETLTVTVAEDLNLNANFKSNIPNIVLITLTPNPAKGGIVFGGGEYTVNDTVTITATANTGYHFVNWTEGGTEVYTEASSTFTAAEDRVLIANFEMIPPDIVFITLIANPTGGGVASGGGEYTIGDSVTITATANSGYRFVNWTEGGTEVYTEASSTFTAAEDRVLMANFEIIPPDIVFITLIANPTEGGTVSGSGEYAIEDSITITATANTDYRFVNWTEGEMQISIDSVFTFTATESRNLTANFAKIVCIEITVNNDEYGKIREGIEKDCYNEGDTIIIEAIPKDCYRFKNWSINGMPPMDSTDNPYMLIATEAIILTAHFYALDFDTYTHIFWNNTFMLDRKKLADDGYEVTGCKWFKDGVEETDTRTVNEFSYSLGPKATDLFDFETATYKWQIHAKNYGNLCSSNKSMENPAPGINNSTDNLFVYPNPVFSGVVLTITGTENDTPIFVYNTLGICVGNYLAKEEVTTITLELPSGIYWIKNGVKTAKTVIVK